MYFECCHFLSIGTIGTYMEIRYILHEEVQKFILFMISIIRSNSPRCLFRYKKPLQSVNWEKSYNRIMDEHCHVRIHCSLSHSSVSLAVSIVCLSWSHNPWCSARCCQYPSRQSSDGHPSFRQCLELVELGCP